MSEATTKLTPDSGSKLRHFACRFTTIAMVAGTLIVSAAAGHADPVTFPTLQSPAPGATTDGCTGCLFSYQATPSAAVGEALTSWSFYALNSNAVTPVIFDSNGNVTGVGTSITPTGVGLQTALFGLAAGNSVLSAGDSVGWFYPGQGSIAVNLNSGPGVVTEAGYGGVRVGDSIDTTSVVPNRTYSVSYTANQVTLTTPSSPTPNVTSDGCVNCLFSYTPVTSQYNGQTLQSWSFYALNGNAVIPVIFGPDGTVIGYGQADVPSGATGLQTFAYVPAAGTAVLQTGDSLGWYYPNGGSIAFTLTGGQGATYAPFPTPSLGIGDYTTTPVIDRDYSVGFSTSSDVAPVPEPSYTIILAACLGMLVFYRRSIKPA